MEEAPKYITVPVVDERLKMSKIDVVRNQRYCIINFSKDGFDDVVKQCDFDDEGERWIGRPFIKAYREAVRDFWFTELGPNYRRLRSQVYGFWDAELSPAEQEALAEFKKQVSK